MTSCTKGGGGVWQKVIFDDEGGGGVWQKVILHDGAGATSQRAGKSHAIDTL